MVSQKGLSPALILNSLALLPIKCNYQCSKSNQTKPPNQTKSVSDLDKFKIIVKNKLDK
jgi:hypothetical protein